MFLFPGISRAASLSLALYGEPKYAAEFTNFDYADPNAPKGGKITMPDYGGFDNFNPFIFKGMASGNVPALTLDTLGVVPADDYSTAYPLVAKAFESTKDYAGFVLDERAEFSDGTPITAADVIFSFNALVEKGSPIYRVYYADVAKAVALNDRHVRFIYKKGTRNKELPLILAGLPIFSARDWQGRDADFATPKLEPYLGSGPYKIDSFAPGKFISFKRNPNYWARDLPSRKGFFNFDEARFDYYQDTTVTLQALFAGAIDLREEYIAKIWVTGYDNDIVKSGRIIKEQVPHNNPAALQNFAFNIRRAKLSNPKTREAVGLAFNFDWANEKLFYGQYKRLYSTFSNTDMAWPGAGFQNPSHKTPAETRANLKKAVKLLQEAGYGFKDGKMVDLKTQEPLEIEVLGTTANGSSFTRVMLPFIENLKKIGIKMTFRTLDPSVFKNRLDAFDFDMAILGWSMGRMPGNEQRDLWGSTSADTKGSLNAIGIKDKKIDRLIDRLVAADTKSELKNAARALDKKLLEGYYMIMQWYSPYSRVAWWDKFAQPKLDPKAPPVGLQIWTWWAK